MIHIIFLVALVFAIPQLNKKYPFRFLTFLILYIFMAIRYDYGNDYMNYFNNHALMNAGLNAWGSNDFVVLCYKYINT